MWKLITATIFLINALMTVSTFNNESTIYTYIRIYVRYLCCHIRRYKVRIWTIDPVLYSQGFTCWEICWRDVRSVPWRTPPPATMPSRPTSSAVVLPKHSTSSRYVYTCIYPTEMYIHVRIRTLRLQLFASTIFLELEGRTKNWILILDLA